MENTKLKLLRILEILQKESSKTKPLTTQQICQKLEKIGMHCERRQSPKTAFFTSTTDRSGMCFRKFRAWD